MRRISSKEITEWLAFYRIEPFGEIRGDIRAAIIACVMANAWRGKNSKVFSMQDFMPKFRAVKKESQTPKEMASFLRCFAERYKEGN